MEELPARPPGSRSLLAALLFLLAVVWLEPAGSGLAEPDETRYAEIPREMLAAGDLLVPRLNGVPYFEKPPLLYWVNAASLRVFGETPWAARFPTRLAGLGTLLLVLSAARGIGAGGLPAAVLFLAAPMGFLFSRTNLTDGLLTFFFTAMLLAGRSAVRRREEKRPWLAMSAIFGAACAAAFLTKGLIALVLPAAIFFIWAISTGRLVATLRTLVLSPAPLVFLVLALPWFLAVERRHPGFLDFFFIREHFQRFATKAAKLSSSGARDDRIGLPCLTALERPSALEDKGAGLAGESSDESLEGIIERASKRVPALENAEVMRGVTGVYDSTPDSRANPIARSSHAGSRALHASVRRPE